MQELQQTPKAVRPVNLTTDQIQKYLDENKELILAILDNQNLGKFAECASYRTRLQENLVYLAGVADWQQAAALVQMSPPRESSDSAQPSKSAISQQQSAPFTPNFPLPQSNQPLPIHHQQLSGRPQIGQGTHAAGNTFLVKHSGDETNSSNRHGSKQEGIGAAGTATVTATDGRRCFYS